MRSVPAQLHLPWGKGLLPAPHCSPSPARACGATGQPCPEFPSPGGGRCRFPRPGQLGAHEAKVPAISVCHRRLINRAEQPPSPPSLGLCRRESIFKRRLVSWADRAALGVYLEKSPAVPQALGPNLPLHPFICYPEGGFHPESPLLWERGPVPSCGAEHPLTRQQFKGRGHSARVWVVSLSAPGADTVPMVGISPVKHRTRTTVRNRGGKEIFHYPTNGSSCFKLRLRTGSFETWFSFKLTKSYIQVLCSQQSLRSVVILGRNRRQDACSGAGKFLR